MFNIVRIVVLGLVFSQGFSVVAMEKKVDSPRAPRSNPLSCSAEARRDGEIIKRTAALKISVEKSKEEKFVYDYPGSSSPVYYPSELYGNSSVRMQMIPYYHEHYCGCP